jgi:hypothetical protein
MFAAAFDSFRLKLAQAKSTHDDAKPSEYWLRYGVATRVNSDRAENIQRRHEFFVAKMYELLQPQLKDPLRLFGAVERELIYYRDRKLCGACDGEVIWDEAEFHHVQQHSLGGKTTLDNGALVHSHCHPKGDSATKEFERKFRARFTSKPEDSLIDTGIVQDEDDAEEEDSI